MAEMRGAARMMNLQQRANDNKSRAQELCSIALEQANALFDEGDLTPYLNMLTKFHWYNFYNLLLILHQCPDATVLRTFREWQNLMNDPQAQVLKDEHKGKGIEIVAPFTNLQPQGTRSLSWYSVKQFDISQTNVQGYVPPPSAYLKGPNHLITLNRALIDALHREYNMNVLPYYSKQPPPQTGNFGHIDGDIIFWRPDLSDEDKVLWFSECLVTLSEPEKIIGERHIRNFVRMAQHCLLRIWRINDAHLLYVPKDKELNWSVPSELRPIFLDLLQRRVRHFEETVYSKYQEILREREDGDISGIDPVAHTSKDTGEKEGNDS